MALILWTLLLSIPITQTFASPVSSAVLTQYITDIVPTCARPCLQSFISSNYPTQVCTAQNFNCLCITPTITSYTLGEAALTCAYSACEDEITNANGLYNLCTNIPGAIPNFHESLVASIVDASATESATQRRSSSASTGSGKTSRSSSSVSSTSKTSSTSTTSTSISSTSSSTSTSSRSITKTPDPTKAEPPPGGSTLPPVVAPSAANTSEPASTSSSLTKPQIAGVVVAAVGAAALSFGFCFFFVCHRRRQRTKERRESDASLIGDKVLNSQDSSPDLSGNQAGLFAPQSRPRSDGKPPLRVVTPSQRGWQEWRNTADSNPQGIGLALGPETTREGPSPMTPASLGTNSQLLPDKPHYTVFPAPHNRLGKQHSRSLQPPVPVYAPEKTPPMTGPRFPSSMDTSQAHLQGNTRSMSDPFYNDQHSPPMEGYRGVPYTPWANPPASLKRPRSIQQGREVGAQPTIYEEPPSPVPLIDQQYLIGAARPRSGKQPMRKKSESSSRYDRSSNGSGTSFEDVDDDYSPPKTALSPVTEIRSPRTNQRNVLTPPLPVKSTKRGSHIINRARPIPRRSGEPVSPGLSVESQDRDVTQTAKYKILVSPGLQSLDESLPSTPRTPTAMAGRNFPRHDDRLPPLAR